MSRNDKLIAKFRSMADRLTAKIEAKRAPMTQNPTPKRMKQYSSRLFEANNLENMQKAMLAMADAMENETLPEILSDVKTKDQIYDLVRHRWDNSGGYYGSCDSGEFANTSESAIILQTMISGSSAEQEERKRQLEIEKAEAKAKLLIGSIPGFYPTPRRIAEKMIDIVRLSESDIVLEPSAGSGAIADVIVERYPGISLDVIECNYSLRDILEKKGYNLLSTYDFLEYDADERYDAIIMNPPFEKRQDCKHVQHAYSFLNDNGILVSVMSEGTFFAGNAKWFIEWLDSLSAQWYDIDLPSGSFKKSGTMVKSRVLVIEK